MPNNKKAPLTERIGDWVCLNCNNLNFSFRDICNRCDLHRIDVGKTIMSAQELESLQLQQQPPQVVSSQEQLNLLCNLALTNERLKEQAQQQPSMMAQPYNPFFPKQQGPAPYQMAPQVPQASQSNYPQMMQSNQIAFNQSANFVPTSQNSANGF